MEILLVVTTLVVAVAVLYVTATLHARTRQTTAPLVDGAVKDITGHLETTTGELRRQLQLMADELQRDREDTRLEERKIHGRLDYADNRLASLASQLMAELETIRRLGEQIGARQDQLSGYLRQLDHQIAQLFETTVRFSPVGDADAETAGVSGPARPVDEAIDSPSGPVAAGPGPG